MKRDILNSFLKEHKPTLIGGLCILLFFVLVSFLQVQNMYLKTDLMSEAEKKTHAPFDGTVFPLDKTLDWVALSSTEYQQFKAGTLTYQNAPANKLISIPKYDTSILKLNPADLSWTSADKKKRNTILTYVTAYMGAYTGGYKPAIEYAGSHLAVDIRAPRGTPIKNIANGVVVKTTESGGNGISAIVLHKNVPDPEISGATTNLYTSYLHLDTLAVSVGDVLKKGDLIGTVGTTGISSTYHLHLQIDRDTAPFHTYWPFSWSDASAAGLDFFSGVNAGLGKRNGELYTVNPMTFIYNGLGGTTTTEQPTNNNGQETTSDNDITTNEQGTTDSDTSTNEPNHESAPEETPAIIEDEPNQPVPVENIEQYIELKAEADRTVVAGNPAKIRLLAVDKNGNRIDSFTPSEPVTLRAQGLGSLEEQSVSKFENGSALVSYTTKEREEANITIRYKDQETAVRIAVIDKLSPVASFDLEVDEYPVEVGTPFMLNIRTMDDTGQPTLSGLYNNAQVFILKGDALVKKSTIAPTDFDGGLYQLAVTPRANGELKLIVREGAVVGQISIEVGKMNNEQSTTDNDIVEEEDKEVAPINAEKPEVVTTPTFTGKGFLDVKKTHPNYNAIMYLKERGVIEGYQDGTFRPDQEVSRAESVKIILSGSGVQPKTKVLDSSFPDVDEDAWYAVWVERGRDLGIISGNPDGTFQPASLVNGAANLKILLLTNYIKTEKLYKTDLDSNPYPDVAKDQWFAKNYQYAFEKNLIPTDFLGNAKPSKSLTRGDVAEVMYRLMVIKETAAKRFDPNLM